MKSETIKALAVDGVVFVMAAVLVIAIIVNVANGTFLIWLGSCCRRGAARKAH